MYLLLEGFCNVGIALRSFGSENGEFGDRSIPIRQIDNSQGVAVLSSVFVGLVVGDRAH
jgi:hypothetical protein